MKDYHLGHLLFPVLLIYLLGCHSQENRSIINTPESTCQPGTGKIQTNHSPLLVTPDMSNILFIPPPDSNFYSNIEYLFRIEEEIDFSTLRFMIPQKTTPYIFMEDKKIEPIPATQLIRGQSYSLYEIGPFCKKGINRVKIHLSSRQDVSLLSAYVTGSFSLQENHTELGIYQPLPLTTGNWTTQGMPYYEESVTYSKIYTFGEYEPLTYLYVSDWKGTRIEIYINNRQVASGIGENHYFKINEYIQPGENRIDIKIFGETQPRSTPFFQTTEWQENPAGQKTFCLRESGLYQDFIVEQYATKE